MFEEEDSEAEVTQEDLDAISVNPPVRRDNKKTERQRKKQESLKKKVGDTCCACSAYIRIIYVLWRVWGEEKFK